MRAWAVVGVGLAVTLASCGSSGSGHTTTPSTRPLPSCADTFKEGAKANLDSSGDWDPTCTENGNVMAGVTAFKKCSNGTRMSWTDTAWEKGGVVHLGAVEITQVCP